MRYTAWVKEQCDFYKTSVHRPHRSNGKVSLEDRAYFHDLLTQLNTGPDVDVLLKVGNKITPILCGDVDAVHILQEERLQYFSNSSVFVPSYERVATYLDAMGH